jgi:uncharacterized protein (TIGR03790 family)
VFTLAVSSVRAESLESRTVIVVNARDRDSVELGEFYADQRGIPRTNVIALPMPAAESVTWREFVDQVWQPLQDELIKRGWLDGIESTSLDTLGRKRIAVTGHRLAYLVVCRGTPLRIYHDPTLADEATLRRIPAQFHTNQGAVDSELSLLAAGNYEVNAFVPNPCFSRPGPPDTNAELVVKVARLDGPTIADARRLVTSALAGERTGLLGRYYVDWGGGPHRDGDRWLEATEKELEQLGFDGDVERTGALFPASMHFADPVFYFGWYASDATGPIMREGFSFAPGAVALHIHSFSAETLRSAEKGWCGPLVARGVTATMGNVFEPFLQFTHRPDLLVQALARGETLGDAAYFALPALSWEEVLIGDPLYRPFGISLSQQLKDLPRLPPDRAGYAVVRKATLLARGGRSAEALALLQAAAQLLPDSREIARELEKLSAAK